VSLRPEAAVEYLLSKEEFGLALAVIQQHKVDMYEFDGARHKDYDDDYHKLWQHMKDSYDLWRAAECNTCIKCRKAQAEEDSETEVED
jgi:hypothetical protein